MFSVCVGAVFGMLGGLLGVALFKKKDAPPPPGTGRQVAAASLSWRHVRSNALPRSEPKLPLAKVCSGARFRAFPAARRCNTLTIKTFMLRYLLAAALVLAARRLGAGDARDQARRRRAGARLVAAGARPRPARPAGSQLPPLPVTQIDQRDAAASLDAQRGLSLSFAEPMPIGEVLRLLVEGTPFSLAIDPDATGTFRGELKRLTLREALTTLLTPLGLDFDVQGTVIRVMHHRAETRQFDLNLLNVQRGMQRTAANGDGSATIATTVGRRRRVRRRSPTASSRSCPRAGACTSIAALGPRAGHATSRSGSIASALYLETLQSRSARQVRLEARVFEVTLRDAPSIDWGVVRERLGLPRDARGGRHRRRSASRCAPRSPRRERSAISGRPR